MTTTLDDLLHKLERIEAAVMAPAPYSRERWHPIGQAADELGYSSHRSLQRAIRQGEIPPRFVSGHRAADGRLLRVAVDVEGLREWSKGRVG